MKIVCYFFKIRDRVVILLDYSIFVIEGLYINIVYFFRYFILGVYLKDIKLIC